MFFGASLFRAGFGVYYIINHLLGGCMVALFVIDGWHANTFIALFILFRWSLFCFLLRSMCSHVASDSAIPGVMELVYIAHTCLFKMKYIRSMDSGLRLPSRVVRLALTSMRRPQCESAGRARDVTPTTRGLVFLGPSWTGSTQRKNDRGRSRRPNLHRKQHTTACFFPADVGELCGRRTKRAHTIFYCVYVGV